MSTTAASPSPTSSDMRCRAHRPRNRHRTCWSRPTRQPPQQPSASSPPAARRCRRHHASGAAADASASLSAELGVAALIRPQRAGGPRARSSVAVPRGKAVRRSQSRRPQRRTGNPPPAAVPGSGKSGTPCARMHLENKSPATSFAARCAGLGATPTNPTPPPLGLDDAEWWPDPLEPEMLATPRLEPPPQPAIRTATPTNPTKVARVREPPRGQWRAVTSSARCMVNGSFASTFSTIFAAG